MSAPVSLSPRSTGWRSVRAVCLVALVAFFVWVMTFRFNNANDVWSLHGDQHQSIGHYWRYAVDGAIPPGHLLSDYAGTYHSSPLWWPVMALLSAIIGPLTAAKVLGVLAYALFAVGAVVVVGRRTEWALSLLVGIVVLRNPPDSVEQITGGMARSMAPALVYAFLWAFMEGRHRLVLAILVLQAGVYPSIVIPCGICYGVYVLVKGPMRDRLGRMAGMVGAGLVIIVLGLAQNLSSPDWWGAPVTYEQAEQMPAWGAGGRFPEVPHRAVKDVWVFNLERPFKNLGTRIAPESITSVTDRNVLEVFVVGPTLLALVVGVVGLVVRRRRARANNEPVDAASQMPFPWQVLALACATMCAYGLVRVFAFRLFLPSRQVGFVVPYLTIVWVPLIAWWAVQQWTVARRWLAFVAVVVVVVVPPFALRGTGGKTTSAGYSGHAQEAKFYTAIRQLPLDQEIACDIGVCEYVMALGQHAPYAARNLTHPLRLGYYQETERRLVEMQRLLHATSVDEIATFVNNEHVHYLAYHRGDVTKLSKRLYRPVDRRVREIFNAGTRKVRLFDKPPAEAVVFHEKDRYIVDLDKMLAALASLPAEVPTAEPAAPKPVDDGEPAPADDID